MAYMHDEYIGDEDDDEEEYTEGENESGDDQRGTKKIENNWRYMRRGNGLLLKGRWSAINLSTGVYANWENPEGRKLPFDWYRIGDLYKHYPCLDEMAILNAKSFSD